MPKPRFGSLFSGIGGFDLGLERAGWEPAWQVEINPFRQRVLDRHWPGVKRYADIRLIEDVESVELVAAGFPCQPFSVAGLNRGEADERNLWPETIRVIRMVGPRLALLENVPGLLAHEYFGTILGDLAEAGYDAEWFCVRASDFGASHRRERLFILAHAGHTGESGRVAAEISCEGESCGEPSPQGVILAHAGCLQRPESRGVSPLAGELRTGETNPSTPCGADELAHADGEGLQGRDEFGDSAGERAARPSSPQSWPPGPEDREGWARVLAEMPSLEPAVCRVADGVPDRTHRLAALGDSAVPAVVEWIGRRLLEGS